MNLFSQQTSSKNPEKIRQIKTWIYELLEIDSEISISISQLCCTEPGCPPIETVIAVMTSPIQQYKIHKPMTELEHTDISEVLQQK
ncbi:MAG TPA: hypothetical protein DCE56_27445 [Cyanobacteria bacterium UBA8553]|nr:hypothetical protein [Cyanobacteria bacterium UBA8553]HAJ61944.1 hypothetical protein [Cyanobacteria bacterium UBA8543]